MNVPTVGVESVEFYIIGDGDLKSKFRVKNPDSMVKNEPKPNGVCDEHMGVTADNRVCITCHNKKNKCPGHAASYELPYPIISPFFEKKIPDWLKLVCLNCSGLVVQRQSNLSKYIRGTMKQYISLVQSKPIIICPHCSTLKQKISPKDGEPYLFVVGSGKDKILYPLDVYNVLDKIQDDDVAFLGKTVKCHPRNMVLNILLVSANTIRPDRKKLGSGKTGSNTTTTALQEIVRIGQFLPNDLRSKPMSDIHWQKIKEMNNLVYDMIYTSAANGAMPKYRSNIAKQKNITSIKQRISGKEGRIRHNLFGKKHQNVIRCVITCNSNIRIDEVGIPINLLHSIQIAEYVRDYNIEKLSIHFRNGINAYPGATHIEKANGEPYAIQSNMKQILEIGDIIYRDLIEGDIVMFNRAPTLTTSSLLSHKIKVMPFGNTIDMNPSTCNFYKADFDGDSMNIPTAPRVSVMAEIDILCGTSRYYISYIDASPQIGEIQDSVIGLSELTRYDTRISSYHFQKLFSNTNIFPDMDPDKLVYTGYDVITELFKQYNLKFNYSRPPTWYNQVFENLIDYNEKDIEVIIENGVHKQGILDKAAIGEGSGTIFHQIASKYSNKMAIDLIYDMQQIAIQHVLMSGFSMGLSDIIIPQSAIDKIHQAESAILEQVSLLNERVIEGRLTPPIGISVKTYYEELVLKSLEFGDDIMKPVIEGINSKTNSFLKLVLTGARGKLEHFRNSLSAIGQVGVEGRTPLDVAGRSLAIYTRNYLDPRSRGFTANSYRTGMGPAEFFFNSMETRISLIKIQLQTSSAGTETRKSVKNFDSSIVNNFRQVVKGTKIVQYITGGDGVNAQFLESIKCPTVSPDMSDKKFNEYHTILKDHPDLISEIDDADIKKYQSIFDNEFKQMKKDRDYYRNISLTFEYDSESFYSNKVMLPVPLTQILYELTPTKDFNLNELIKSVEYVKALLNDVSRVFFNSAYDGVVPATFKAATKMFRIVFLSLFNSKEFIRRKVSSRSVFITIEKVIGYYKRALIDPGTAIGIISAQSISQPNTQGALDSKNKSGLNDSNKSLKAFQEITAATPPERMQVPCMSLRVKKKHETDQLYVKTVANKIEMMNLNMFISSTHVLQESVKKAHPKFKHDVYIEEFINNNTSNQPPNDLGNIVILFMINKVMLIQKQMTMLNIYIRLQLHFPEFYFVYTNENQKDCFIRAYFRMSKITKSGPIDRNYLSTRRDDILNYNLNGVEGIKRTAVVSKNKSYIAEDGTIKSKNVYEIRTIGTNLDGIMNIKELDHKRCQSNSIVETYNVFGLAACRRKIGTELRKQVASPLPRWHDHYSDEMLFSGEITPIERFGLSAKEYKSVLLRMSESDPVSVMTNAAADNLTDDMSSPSAFTAMGQCPKVGSNYNKIIEDYTGIDEDSDDILDEL
jgi:DNA-directed RNA polymerase II subunit RPB1